MFKDLVTGEVVWNHQMMYRWIQETNPSKNHMAISYEDYIATQIKENKIKEYHYADEKHKNYSR